MQSKGSDWLEMGPLPPTACRTSTAPNRLEPCSQPGPKFSEPCASTHASMDEPHPHSSCAVLSAVSPSLLKHVSPLSSPRQCTTHHGLQRHVVVTFTLFSISFNLFRSILVTCTRPALPRCNFPQNPSKLSFRASDQSDLYSTSLSGLASFGVASALIGAQP